MEWQVQKFHTDNMILLQGSKFKKSSGHLLSREIQVNSLAILSNACWYNILETYLGYRSQGCLTAENLQIYLKTSSPKWANNVPKLPGLHCVVKNQGTSHDVKSFATGSFLNHYVVRIANDYLAKNIKHAHQISAKSIDS